MKYIKLTQNQKTKVDDADYEWLSQWNWQAIKNKWGYRASRTTTQNGKEVHIMLSRLIMGFPEGLVVDHINGDTLDNRRCNLRVCTTQQNHWNRRVGKNNTSGFVGVSWNKHAKKWMAAIRLNTKTKTLGYRDTPEEASLLYKAASKKYFNEFVRSI